MGRHWWAGPAHQVFKRWVAARRSASHFKTSRPAHQILPGPDRPVTLAARPMRHGLYTGRPAISMGRPVDLMGRATGWPTCCLALSIKGTRLCADVLFSSYFQKSRPGPSQFHNSPPGPSWPIEIFLSG